MMKPLRFFFSVVVLSLLPSGVLRAAATNKGDLANLVCFVRFADETQGSVFARPFSEYASLFNDNAPEALSMYNYFRVSSYGQLSWRTTFFPSPQGDQVMAYQSKLERGYYQPYSAGINESGYKDDVAAAARLQALALEVADYLDRTLPADQVIDADGDGFIDNVTLVLSGSSAISAKQLLWPKRMDILTAPGKEAYIHGKRFVGYLMVFDDANGYKNVMLQGLTPMPLSLGLICHESAHSLGTYDLYHAADNLNPVAGWDLMSDQGIQPQQMTVFTKMKYGRWVESIPEISAPGVYTLNPVGGSTAEQIAYKIKPVGHDEYFVVEYRKKSTFDSTVPESGLIVYRINPNTGNGNVNYNGKTVLDELYVLRPGGSLTSDGNIALAAFSKESGRTALGGGAAQKPFYSDGTEANFSISNVSACGETISFTLGQSEKRITLTDTTLTLNGAAGSAGSLTVASDVTWTLGQLPEWLSASAAGGSAGSTELTFTAATENTAAQSRVATLTLTDSEGLGLVRTITVAQRSNTLAEPQALKAVATGEGVQLSWNAVPVGTKMLSEDFENTANPNGWVMSNLGGRGWHWQQHSSAYKAFEGSYSGAMWSAWDDEHQDETLTSPTLKNASTLVFRSNTTGMGRFPTNNPQEYNVEVSSDNGATWTVLVDVRTLAGTEMSNKYMEVALDLTPYASEEMKVRFHAFDKPLNPDKPLGLSYNWMVDNIELYGAGSLTLSGYNIYRNGVLVGTSQTPSFVDTSAPAGEAVYTVTAMSSIGESSPSAPVTVAVPTGISHARADGGRVVAVYTLGGVRLGTNLTALPKGVYVVKSVGADGKRVVRKISVK